MDILKCISYWVTDMLTLLVHRNHRHSLMKKQNAQRQNSDFKLLLLFNDDDQ